MQTLKVIQRDMKKLRNNQLCSDVVETIDNPWNWRVRILGPPDSPFAGGAFWLSIRFCPDFPLKPPKLSFETQVFHPNVDRFGNISMSVLRKDGWYPQSISQVIQSICSLLSSPNLDDAHPSEPQIKEMFLTKQSEYEATVRHFVQVHAME